MIGLDAMMDLALYGDSDIGRVRRVNEDSFRLIPACSALVVCDGMGGHAAGEIASRRAVETVEAALAKRTATPQFPSGLTTGHPALPDTALELAWAVRLANRRVFLTAQAQRQMRGMGTTLVAARFVAGSAIICHVGDSRAYLWRAGRLEALTIDHSLVAELVAQNEITAEQARTFADRNIITRALGTRPNVAVDVTLLNVQPGDWFLFCTDGLSGALTDEEIAAVLAGQPDSPVKAISNLITAANAAGGIDNVTVAIAVVRKANVESTGAAAKATIPEADETEAAREVADLEALFPMATHVDPPEPHTDKVPIDPALQAAPSPETPTDPGGVSARRRRGLWSRKNDSQ